MTSFTDAKYLASACGAERIESGLEAAQHFSSMRGAALLLLSAMAAAVISVAYEVMDTTTEGHLLVIWMGLWAALFTALVLLANAALGLKGRLDAWSHRVALKRADARLWAMAEKDERLMADLQAAIRRQQALKKAAQGAAPSPAKAEPAVKWASFIARPYR